MNIVLEFVLIVIIIVLIIAIYYIISYNKLQKKQIRIEEAESVIDNCLREKYDIMTKIDNLVKTNISFEVDYFKDLKKIKTSNISNFDFDRKLTEIALLIDKIKNDYPILDDNHSLKDMLKKIKLIDEKLEASKAYFNKFTSELNELIKSAPINIIARIHGFEHRNYFDGKDMTDKITNDFKL